MADGQSVQLEGVLVGMAIGVAVGNVLCQRNQSSAPRGARDAPYRL